jgi:hypothetical protein
MSFGHALYYPHINLTNKNWVKHALLFWDKISRIVPQSVEPSDSEDIIRMKSDFDFIEDYHPKPWDTTNTFHDFSNELRTIIESDQFFNERYFVMDPHRRNYMRDYENKRRFFSELVQTSGTYIHIEKMDPRMKEFLFQIGVAIPGRNEWEDWIKVDSEIGLLYMTYFAKCISKNQSLPIVTDVETSFSASNHFESRINSDYNAQFEYHLGNLLIDTIVPKNINDVPIDKIIDIRRKYDDERRLFFGEVSDLSNSISGIDNGNALKDALKHHSKLILKSTKDLEHLYNSQGIETINKFLSISIPSTLASLTEYVPSSAKPFIASGGIIFGLISAAKSVKKEKLELKSNPKSYLLNLKSELSGDNLFIKLNDTLKGIRKF